MEAKYYTPSLEEFYIGFEYEFYYHPLRYKDVNNSCFWEKRVYTGKDFAGHHVDGDKDYYDAFLMLRMEDCALGINELIRVKYLDAQDIEECGFTFTGKSIDIWFKKDVSETPGGRNKLTHVTLHYNLQDYELKIDCYFGQEHEGCLFEGFVKNKSELQKILKMLNIK